VPCLVVAGDSQNMLEVTRLVTIDKVRGWTEKMALCEIHTIHTKGEMWT
jgi:hypothetical protein